jgi:hypothetical protein
VVSSVSDLLDVVSKGTSEVNVLVIRVTYKSSVCTNNPVPVLFGQLIDL